MDFSPIKIGGGFSNVKISAFGGGGGGLNYELAVGDNALCDTTTGVDICICALNETHVVTFGNQNIIQIFEVASDGSSISLVSSVAGPASGPDTEGCALVAIDSSPTVHHFALINRNYIYIYETDADYTPISQKSVLNHHAGSAEYASACLLDSNHIAAHYKMDAVIDYGYIEVFTWDGNYQNIQELDSISVTGLPTYCDIAKLDDTHIVTCYTNSVDGYAKVIEFDGSYQMTEVSSILFDTTEGRYCGVAAIDATHYMVAHRGSAVNGIARTIDTTNPTGVEKDNYAFSNKNTIHCSVAKIDETHLLVCAAGGVPVEEHNAWILEIDGNYNISALDTIEVFNTNPTFTAQSKLVKLTETLYVLASQGPNSDGYIYAITVS